MDARERDSLFEAWTREHAAILERAARAFARPADRDDLLQELLLAVWRAVPAFRHGSKVSTFLYRVAHNAALTWVRARRSRPDLVAEPLPEVVDARSTEQPLAGESDGPGRLVRLYEAIRMLPEVDRSLVLLSLDGVSYAEIAAVHGLSESNVGVRLTRARKTLARTLQPLATVKFKESPR